MVTLSSHDRARVTQVAALSCEGRRSFRAAAPSLALPHLAAKLSSPSALSWPRTATATTSPAATRAAAAATSRSGAAALSTTAMAASAVAPAAAAGARATKRPPTHHRAVSNKLRPAAPVGIAAPPTGRDGREKDKTKTGLAARREPRERVRGRADGGRKRERERHLRRGARAQMYRFYAGAASGHAAFDGRVRGTRRGTPPRARRAAGSACPPRRPRSHRAPGEMCDGSVAYQERAS